MRLNVESALRRVLFLSDAPVGVLEAFARAGTVRRLDPEELLFCENDSAPALFVVVAGAVKLLKWDSRGRKLTLGIARVGDVVGSPAVFDGGNCLYHAAALGGDAASAAAAEVFAVPRATFLALLTAHPVVASGVVRFLAVQNRRLIEMLKAQALHTVRARFAAYLLNAAGDGDSFTLPESNTGIAAHLGTVREGWCRALCINLPIRDRSRCVGAW